MGMSELQRQLKQAKQELASRETASSTKALVDSSADLKRELQDKDQQLLEAPATGSNPLLWIQLTNLGQGRDRANDQVRELLLEGQQLEARYNELKQKTAASTAELESKLRVAQMELEGSQRQCD